MLHDSVVQTNHLVQQGNDGLPEGQFLGPQSACLCMGSVCFLQHQAKNRGNDYGLRWCKLLFSFSADLTFLQGRGCDN